MIQADVIVIGAGPAGAAVSKHLARAGHDVLMVDGGPTGELKIGESLPGAARPLLRDLGLLDTVLSGGHLPHLGNVSAWGSDKAVPLDSIRDPNGPGWHLNRAQFDNQLREAAVAAGASWHHARLRTLADDGEHWQVELDDDTNVQARWVIDATGRAAAVCTRHLGISRQVDTPLVALYAWGPETGHDRRTLIESVPDGWWYTAPQPNGTRVAALHVSIGTAAELRPREAWLDRLRQTRHVQHACDLTGTWTSPRGTPAGGVCLEQMAGSRWLAVGDAALAYDPLASQGLFNALYTALRGGQAVDAALKGDPAAVPTYAARLQHVRATYCRQVLHHYRSESRWPGQPFWQERQWGR